MPKTLSGFAFEKYMDLLNGNIKKLYLNYLAAAFGSALVTSIYGVVDMAMVGQYHGPVGAAAMSVIAPIWNIVYSLGLLTGIGGSILYSAVRGYDSNRAKANQYFTAGIIYTAFLSLVLMICLWTFEDPLLIFFGADEELLGLSKRYLFLVRFAVPSFLFSQILAAFLRNDGVPGLATKAVIIGGVFNIFGDYFLVFTLDLGIMGAGIATCAGSLVGVAVMLTHFFSSKCTLQLVKTQNMLEKWRKISVSGFSAFFVDIAMGILTMLFNRQIMKCFGTDALAVYGVIVNISTFVQCCAYGVGQAAQPILSQNFGAGKTERIWELVFYNMLSVGILAVIWLFVSMLFPNAMIRLFMDATDSVLKIAPFIIRSYAISFPFLLLNIYSTYYFQSVMQPRTAFAVSVSRGLIISGGLIYLLPILLPADSIWFAMPITEALVSAFVMYKMRTGIRLSGKIREFS